MRDASSSVKFLRFALGYWVGKGAGQAWLVTIAVAAAMVGQIGFQIGLNLWNRAFFDALGRFDSAGVWRVASYLAPLIVALTLVSTGLVVGRLCLQALWRAWVTDRLAGWWIADQRYYRLGVVAPEIVAPEFRIADDARLAIEPLVDFAIGIATAVITAASFAGILWTVAGGFTFSLYGHMVTIPAYMALAAVAYSAVASISAYVTGRPLVSQISLKNQAEAEFRAEMSRLRENGESIALIRADADERSVVGRAYAAVRQGWLAVIRRQGWISLVLTANASVFPIIPLLLAAPKYLDGALTLGAVMQVVAAFSAVQSALIWFVDNFVRLAEWRASASRVAELTALLQDIDVGGLQVGEERIRIRESDDRSIHIDDLSIADRGGRTFIAGASVVIGEGEKVMIAGGSGSGKSTLIRALAGLWPWGSGEIRLPRGATLAFVPQRPYIPAGTLRDAILYPAAAAKASDAKLRAAMRRCDLAYFVKRLDERDIRWDHVLSGGERQRVAFCRLLLQRPDIIVMDEATSALDDASQTSLLALLHEDFAASTVVSVGHRAEIEEFHDRKITIETRGATGALVTGRLRRSLWRLLAAREAPSPTRTAS